MYVCMLRHEATFYLNDRTLSYILETFGDLLLCRVPKEDPFMASQVFFSLSLSAIETKRTFECERLVVKSDGKRRTFLENSSSAFLDLQYRGQRGKRYERSIPS